MKSETIRTLRRSALAIGLAAGLLVAHQVVRAEEAAPSKEEAEGIIFERQQIMLQLEKDSDALGDIAAGLRPIDQLAKTAQAIAQGAKESRDAFKAKVPGGRAKPEVWTNWADYQSRLDKFVIETEAMAKIAETGDLTAVTGMMITALPCKECHDLYRAPKKPAV